MNFLLQAGLVLRRAGTTVVVVLLRCDRRPRQQMYSSRGIAVVVCGVGTYYDELESSQHLCRVFGIISCTISQHPRGQEQVLGTYYDHCSLQEVALATFFSRVQVVVWDWCWNCWRCWRSGVAGRWVLPRCWRSVLAEICCSFSLRRELGTVSRDGRRSRVDHDVRNIDDLRRVLVLWSVNYIFADDVSRRVVILIFFEKYFSERFCPMDF